MKIDFWTRYSELGASSRLRFFQFVPLLAQYGCEVKCFPFFDDSYLNKLYSGKRRFLPEIAGYYRRRRKQLAAAGPDTPAVIEYELLPFMPYFMEAGFLKKRKYVLNFDDAVDLHYEKIPVLKNKYPALIANAAGIITANDMLLEKFSRFNRNTVKLPTIPPAAIVPGAEDAKSGKLTLVWTGTPITYRFLLEKASVLRQAAEKTPFQLLITGGDPAQKLAGVDCQYIPWSEKAEADALARSHAGIMPLPDTPFTRGKSAYKLLCYLRAGIPGIASPVGENTRVIRHGENGFLANSDQSWIDAISRLADAETRKNLSAAALADGQNYLPGHAAEKMAEFFKHCFNIG